MNPDQLEAVRSSYPSKFIRWFDRKAARPFNPESMEDEALYRAWKAGYECCFKERIGVGEK